MGKELVLHSPTLLQKFHPLGSTSANTTRKVTLLKSTTTASTTQNYATTSSSLSGPVKTNATQIGTTVSSVQNESKRVDQVAEKMISNAYQSAATSSPFTYVDPSPALALAAMNPDDSSTHEAIKWADGQEEVESTKMLSDSDGPLMTRHSLTKMNNDQLAQKLQSMSLKTSIESSAKTWTELSNDQLARPLRRTPSNTGGVASSEPLTAMSNDQLMDLLESISSMSASTLKPKT